MQGDDIGETPQEVAPEASSFEIAPGELPLPAPEREPFWGYTDLFLVLGLLFGFSVVVVVMVGLLAIPYPSLRTDQTPLALPVQVAFYGCLYASFAVVLGLRHHRPVLSSLGCKRPHINLAWMAGGGIVLAFVLSALGSLLKTPKIDLPFEKLTSTPVSLTFFAIVAIVLAPFFEELFFRGFVQPLLSRTFGTIAGILITAALFGALHGFEYSWVWQYAVFISLAGAVFGWLRARTNSIVPSTIMHGCFNAVSVVALAFGKNI
jgi:membrane protease YdiL (CAAX protease family)